MTDFELFDDYLAGRLTADEKTSFEQRLDNEPGLSASFRAFQSVQNDMEQWNQTREAREALKETLRSITAPAKKSKVRSMGWYLWRAAAMLIVAAAIWWLLLPPSKNEQQLYAEYAAGEQISFSRGSATDSLWEQAAGQLYDKKYNEAVVPLKAIISSGKDSTQMAAVYLGYCYMQDNKNEQAEAAFNSITSERNAEQRNWYKALLYLKTDRKDLCQALLKDIAAGDGSYSGKAKQLLKALR